jgi:hypothetical protein
MVPSNGASRIHVWTAVVLLISALMAGCAAPTAAPTTSPSPTVAAASASYGPVATTVTDGTFRLTAHADRSTYHAGDAIGMHAIVTYLGPAPAFAAYGSGPTSGGGLVVFDVRQLDGSVAIHGTSPADCAPQPPLVADAPQAFPFVKSGAFDPSASSDFESRYFADPLLHLPGGRWMLTTRADILGPDCTLPAHQLTASIEVTVLP